MAESRKYPRMRVLKGAKIILGTVFDCVVRALDPNHPIREADIGWFCRAAANLDSGQI